jgi:hypothetical protein
MTDLQPHVNYPQAPYAPPRRASGLGITALVLGLVFLLIAWFPFCGSLPALVGAGIGLILGIVGWAIAAKRPDIGRGLPIAGTLICALTVLVAIAATVLPSVLIGRAAQGIAAASEMERQVGQEMRRRHERPWTQPETQLYAGSSPSHLAGTGFLIEVDGKILAVTARHPFGDERPQAFVNLLGEGEGPDELKLGARIYEKFDVQVFELDGESQGLSALRYPGPMSVSVGDRVVVLTDAGALEGVVTDDAGDVLSGSIRLDEPAMVAGASGAPILLKDTGTVIGLLQGADDPEQATVVTFVSFGMPTQESSNLMSALQTADME